MGDSPNIPLICAFLNITGIRLQTRCSLQSAVRSCIRERGRIGRFEEDGNPMHESDALDLKAIRAAARRIAGLAVKTPVVRTAAIDRETGAQVLFKCELFQPTGAFKLRGAGNTVLSLTDGEASNGVCTHSSGNHGAALAYAARERGVPCIVCMPENSVKAKVDAVRRYGAVVVFCEATQRGREEALDKVIEETGAHMVHPYDDPRIMAGQGTCGFELAAQAPSLDVVMTPVGGGGLIAGTATAVKALSPKTRVWGAEPAGADDAFQSLRRGVRVTDVVPDTIADGLRATVGELTFDVIRRRVDGIFTVSEEEIVDAMRWCWRELKLVVEPSAAVPVAALRANPRDFEGKRVGIVLTGGNVDLDRLPWME